MEETTVDRKDIYLVAALMCRGITLEDHFQETDLNGIVKTVFRLSGSGINDLEREWLSSSMMVNALQYKESLQRVKAILYEK